MSRQYTGWLGWSNTRGGIDFYHSAEDGRHNLDPQYQGHGHLLAFDITTDDGLYPLEGRNVVVIVGNDRAEEPDGFWFTPDSLAAALTQEGPLVGDDSYDYVAASPEDTREYAAAIIQAAKAAAISSVLGPEPEVTPKEAAAIIRAAKEGPHQPSADCCSRPVYAAVHEPKAAKEADRE